MSDLLLQQRLIGKGECRFGLHSLSPLITALLGARDPSAIRRLIVSVVVNTLNGQSGSVAGRVGPSPEGLKVCAPFGTDRNTSGSIIRKALAPLFTAAAQHTPPDSVKARLGFARSMAVNVVSIRHPRPPETSATNGEPPLQTGRNDANHLSAITLAKPDWAPVLTAFAPKNNQSSEALAGKIEKLLSHAPEVSQTSRFVKVSA